MTPRSRAHSGARSRTPGINPWVPNQHGAWAMLLLPPLAGAIAAPSLVALPVAVAWVVGYFSFFAFGLWLKARNPTRRARYRTPTAVYGGVAGLAALIALVARPSLAWWAVVFGPLVAIAVYETWRHRPRSLASGVTTALASAALFPVMVTAAGQPLTAHVLFATGVLAAYFVGTIFYVKTMIRERRNPAFYRLSVAYHALAVVALVLGFLLRPIPWVGLGFSLMVLVVALCRAAAVPRLDATRGATPKQVGMWEGPLCFGATLAALLV